MNSQEPKSRRKKRWDIPNTAHGIIKQNGQPMGLKELKNQIDQFTDHQVNISLSTLHTELNLDGRFVFTPQNLWALKSQVQYRLSRTDDEYDLMEDNYLPLRKDYKLALADDDDDSMDDESELLVPFEEDSTIDEDAVDPEIIDDDLLKTELVNNDLLKSELVFEDDLEEDPEEDEEDFPV